MCLAAVQENGHAVYHLSDAQMDAAIRWTPARHHQFSERARRCVENVFAMLPHGIAMAVAEFIPTQTFY